MKGNIIAVDYAETNNLNKSGYIKTLYSHMDSTVELKGGGSAGGASSGNPIIFNEETDMPGFPGWENKAPGKDFEWRGTPDISKNNGGWFNSKTQETLHWDVNHGEPYGPHWDYQIRGKGWKNGYRIFPDGTWMRKELETEGLNYVRK